MKKLIIVLLCFALFFCSCKKSETDFYEPYSETFVYSEEYPEPEPDGTYLFFPDFAVDFTGGWYRERSGIVCQFTRSIKDAAVNETVIIKNPKATFRKTDKEHSDALYSEETTFGGYPAMKYVTKNPEGLEGYREYIYEYYIAMGEKLIHISFFPESTESLKNQREFFEKCLDTIVPLNTDFPESLYDMSTESFLSGKNDRYLQLLFDGIVCAFIENGSEGFDSADKISSEILLSAYLYTAKGHFAMYPEEGGNIHIPASDVAYVLDKYFSGYNFEPEEVFEKAELSEGGKTFVFSSSLPGGFYPLGEYKLESVSDNGGGSLCVKYLLSGTEGGKTVRYSLVIRPSENRCVIEKLEIEHFG